VYSFTGVEKSDKNDAESTRLLDRGSEIHDIIQTLMHAKYPGFRSEVKVNGYGNKGSCDGLLPVADGMSGGGILDLDPPELVPIYELQEYKSIATKGGAFLKPKPYGKPGPSNQASPKPEHVKQARIYYMLLENQGYLMDGIRIVYVDRDHLTVLHEFEVEPWTPEEVGTWLTELDVLNMHVEEETLPDRMPDDYWLCRYCDWFTTCKGEE